MSNPPPAPGPARGRDEEDEDSVVKAANSLTLELGAQSRGRREAEERARVAEVELAETRQLLQELRQAAAERRSRGIPWGKIGGALAAFLVASAGWIEVRTGVLRERVDTVQTVQRTEKQVTANLEPRVVQLEKLARAKAERDKCLQGQMRSAIVRGTGHAITSAPELAVHWASEDAPLNRPPMLWPRAAWFPTDESSCPPEPKLEPPPE